ncbi:flagellar hook assembly protein FlgD [Larsenimonas rhizosphaerae]|uniref:Basal-body rod modification protein FlgD n=1 Tax=Larsenimonas rhizosphaerae TaxID=2944682 RepID=A0AA42CSZ8_9GAMM|nr:flagellar hook assembly protein FlgD [Larsenimonas rhizosphaerae]MCX2523102.1 flagellar hook assembly protein FlgD [Larsenimonas rhizosphaerae]
MAISASALSAINGTANASSSSTKAVSSDAAEMKDQFLTLLITQMQNQDPLNPMENSEMTSQLAQINTVSGISELNETLAAITKQINTTQQLQATALVDKGVMVSGNDILVGEDGVITPFGISLDDPASNVTVSIRDAVGNTVRTYDMGAIDAGTQSFYWDGSMDDGGVAEAGAGYKFSIEASNSAGKVPSTALDYGFVRGVNTINGETSLDIGTRAISLGDVYQVL